MAGSTAASDRRRTGRVTAFDADSGLGSIGEFGFHCVSIGGGRRQIAVGAPVTYRVALRLGRPEAVDLVDLSTDPSTD